LGTSLTVPSPPAAEIVSYPFWTASHARARAAFGPVVRISSQFSLSPETWDCRTFARSPRAAGLKMMQPRLDTGGGDVQLRFDPGVWGIWPAQRVLPWLTVVLIGSARAFRFLFRWITGSAISQMRGSKGRKMERDAGLPG
jgi:hypothetical protein